MRLQASIVTVHGPPGLNFELLKLLNFDFYADLYQGRVFQSYAYPASAPDPQPSTHGSQEIFPSTYYSWMGAVKSVHAQDNMYGDRGETLPGIGRVGAYPA